MVRLRIQIKSLFIHFILLVGIFFVQQPAILIIALAVVLIHFLIYKQYNQVLLCGVYALCMGGTVVYYSYSLILVIVVLFSRTKYRQSSFIQIRKRFSLLFLYLIVMYLVQLTYNFSYLSFPLFIVTFLSPIAILFYIGKIPENKISLSYLLNNIVYIALIQVFIAFFLQAVPAGISSILHRSTIGDRVQGTTGSAPNLAVLLAVSIMPFLFNIGSKFNTIQRKFLIAAIAIVFMGMTYLNDAKTIVYAVIMAFSFIYVLNRFLLNKGVIIKVIFSLIFLLCMSFALISIDAIISKLDDKYGEYIYGRYDAKSVFYQETFDFSTRLPLQYIFGTGPGTNGSRASNALAYDVMYKKENTLTLPSFIPPKSSPFTRIYLSPLYQKDYADASRYRSAELGNPFNSICALFLEFGVVGTIIFFYFILGLIRSDIRIGNPFLSRAVLLIVLANIILAVLDQAFESPVAMHMMYMFVGLSLLKKDSV